MPLVFFYGAQNFEKSEVKNDVNIRVTKIARHRELLPNHLPQKFVAFIGAKLAGGGRFCPLPFHGA